MFRQEFQRDKPTEFCVLSFVHHSHAATAQFLKTGRRSKDSAARLVLLPR
jgi:3-methyladenine DNA glycosylase AlkC